MSGPTGSPAPRTAREGTRWLATATAAVMAATIAVALRSPDGPRPWPLLAVGLPLVLAGVVAERRGRRGPVPSTLFVVGAVTLLVAAEAFVDPTGRAVDAFLACTGAAFLLFGVVRDDRRLVVVGLVQWATAVGRPDGDVFRHCLVATDVRIPLPRVEPLIALGVAALLVAVLQRHHGWRVDAARGLENVGLALALGALSAKALELPGHPALCGTGDAIDAGWALLLLAAATVVGVLGVRWADRLWASAGLAAATLFGLAAIALERNPLWGVLVGVPLLGILVWLEATGVPWPQRESAPLRDPALPTAPPTTPPPTDEPSPP